VSFVQPRELDPALPRHPTGDAEPRRERAVAAQRQDDAGDGQRSVERDLEELVAEEEARHAPGRGQVPVRGGSGIAQLRAVAPSRLAPPTAARKRRRRVRGGGAQPVDLVGRALVETRGRAVEADEPLDAAGGHGGGKSLEEVQVRELQQPVEDLRTTLPRVAQPPGQVATDRPPVVHHDGVDAHAAQRL